jgi:uncharacterized protein YneF (UPF0154 family)
MSKLGTVICLLLGPAGWFYLAYKFMENSLPGERKKPLHEWHIPKGISKGYRKVKW